MVAPPLPPAPQVVDEIDQAPADFSIGHDDLVEDLHLIDLDLTGVEAEDAVFIRCRFERVRFTAAVLDRVRMTDCELVDCDLSGATSHEAVLRRVAITDSRATGLSFTAARIRETTFAGCRLDAANLRSTTFEHVRFDRCDLRDSDLYGVDATKGLVIRDSDLGGAELSKAKLAGVRLHGTTLERLRGAEALRGIVIGSDQVVPTGYALVAALAISVDDEEEVGDESDET